MHAILPSYVVEPSRHLHLLVLLATVGIASYTDILNRKIPNWLTALACVLGFVFASLEGGWAGFLWSLAGFGMYFWTGYVFYRRIGGIGAGDIKLLMAVATLCGAYAALWIALLSFCLQLLWLLGFWIFHGTARSNLRAVSAWFQWTIQPRSGKNHYAPIGTADKSPHAPFVFLATVMMLMITV